MNKYKAIPRKNNNPGCTCEGCAGEFSHGEVKEQDKGKCIEISDYIANSPEYYPPCVGSDGVIYVEVKK